MNSFQDFQFLTKQKSLRLYSKCKQIGGCFEGNPHDELLEPQKLPPQNQQLQVDDQWLPEYHIKRLTHNKGRYLKIITY